MLRGFSISLTFVIVYNSSCLPLAVLISEGTVRIEATMRAIRYELDDYLMAQRTGIMASRKYSVSWNKVLGALDLEQSELEANRSKVISFLDKELTQFISNGAKSGGSLDGRI